MRRLSGFLLGLLGLVYIAGAQAQDTKGLIRLSTLEWPPYTGLLLPQQGISTRVASVVSKAAGYRLLTAYFEWTTTLEKGEKDPGFEGYFPEYFNKDREQACHLSGSIGTSLLGVATLKSNPIYWQNLSDLSAYKLAVVDGYSNGEVFDKLVADKRQPVEVGPSDAANLTKLLSGKVRAIVIDKNVLNYTASRNGSADRVVFNPKPIAELTLHVCFKRTPQGKKLRDDFDAALKTVTPARLEDEYLKNFKFAY